MTLLWNLLTAVIYLPQAVGILWRFGGKSLNVLTIISRIRAVLGSEPFQRLIEAIAEAVKAEEATLAEPPDTETKRWRLFDRVRQRFALNQLGMTEMQYVAFCDKNGVANELTA